jgi:tetratricopeptide (TPR) repeat protein
LNLAGFLGSYRDPDQCFAILEEAYKPELTSQIVSVALDTERLQRETIGDKYDAIIQQWLDRALRENPGMTELLILQAEFFNLQERFEDAVANYQKLLKDPNLKGPKRAIVLNNLSFMIALLGDKAQTNIDALKLVQEAVQLLGPTDAILDTRAVVNTAQGNYDRAIEDLELSISDEPTAAKYFHLVAAHLGAGQNQAALQAWDKAMELGLSVQDLDYMELGRFDTIKAKIEQLRPQSSTAPDAAPLSAAG